MAENNKKRAGSFRKLFPNLFFKSKEKTINKDSQTNLKSASDSSKGNQYQTPRSIRSDKHNQGPFDRERIYENLTTHPLSDNETHSNEISSNHSSSSTLVSESARNKSYINEGSSDTESIAYTLYTARPQVPPKPFNDSVYSPQTTTRDNKQRDNMQYPDVYYHSLEKLSDKISPLDEIEIYKASQTQTNPASVGAEIKRVSTKFLISPKKEAEVRTIQPTRARSLSFDNNKEIEKDVKGNKSSCAKSQNVKAYNYSAPTSPIPVNHKIPNMPKTVSPYEHVRKVMMETEEKRNSLSRSSLRNKTTSSPRPEYMQRSTPTPIQQENAKSFSKEKTRQKVEAFYWQKLKELKQKEDEYLIRQSLNSSQKNTLINNIYDNSNKNSVNSLPYMMEPRSCSLPRGTDFQTYGINPPIGTSTPFNRGAPERRTDTFIKSRNNAGNPDIVYRHPEKLIAKTQIYQRGTMSTEDRNMCQTKRVSFEEQLLTTNSVVRNDNEIKANDYQVLKPQYECDPNYNRVCELQSRVPPRPPIRTTSVSGISKIVKVGNNKRIINLAGGSHSLCSESESGSEAGEIQRILQSIPQKEFQKRIDCMKKKKCIKPLRRARLLQCPIEADGCEKIEDFYYD